MNAARRRAGFTLIELLVALALATIVIGVMAAAFSQTQRTMSVQTVRQDASRAVINLFDDLERDLSGLLPAAAAPAPFSVAGSPPVRVLELEAQDARPAPPRDRLRMLTMVPTNDTAGGAPSYTRALVEWDLTARTPNAANGPDAGRVRRRVLSCVSGGALTTPTGPGAEALELRDGITFEVEWLAPDGTYKAPDGSTKDGAAFALGGTLTLAQTPQGTEASATGADGAALDALPIGGELGLVLAANAAPTRAIVRRRPAGGGRVLLADRFPPQAGVTWSTFQGPPALRVTVVVPFGRGPDGGTARMSRTFHIPR